MFISWPFAKLYIKSDFASSKVYSQQYSIFIAKLLIWFLDDGENCIKMFAYKIINKICLIYSHCTFEQFSIQYFSVKYIIIEYSKYMVKIIYVVSFIMSCDSELKIDE